MRQNEDKRRLPAFPAPLRAVFIRKDKCAWPLARNSFRSVRA
jgi:hypothetical protein